MEFNEDKTRKITSEILVALKRLEELEHLSKKEFLADPHKIGSAKYNFIVTIEGIIDLCNHIISKNAFRTPDDYADTFRVMNERGAFQPKTSHFSSF
ncbi:MAG: HepT-like ribonuclease domain-containing protein [Nitrospirota bacterium]